MNNKMTGAAAFCSRERVLDCSRCSHGSAKKILLLPMLTGSTGKLFASDNKTAPVAPTGAGKVFYNIGFSENPLREQSQRSGSKNRKTAGSKTILTPTAPIAPIYINKNNIIYSIGGIYSL